MHVSILQEYIKPMQKLTPVIRGQRKQTDKFGGEKGDARRSPRKDKKK